ncbi:MAG: phosphoribosylformylglycinamidine synthase subunit PurQ [Pirellulales bacterium]|jgi:phosphoribosylformylglycinamidine synthase I
MLSPRALILRAPGTNCDHETAFAFERAGALARRVHVQALAERPAMLDEFQIFCIPGGFSYGDDIASGRILALQLRTFLSDALEQFRDRGGLILGICNGFQVLLQTSLLLHDPQTGPLATLAANTSGRFIDRWVTLDVRPSRSVFLEGLGRLELPVAHAEGRFRSRSVETLAALEASGQLALRYGLNAEGGPSNPNGSEANVAGVCDATGRVLGLMPHPERFLDAIQHPALAGTKEARGRSGVGLALFTNAVRAVS